MTKAKSPWGIDRMNEAATAANTSQMDAIKEECLLYAAVFNTSAGQKILAKLKATLESPTWSPDRKPEYGYYREGQNDVIRHIINRINKAKEF